MDRLRPEMIAGGRADRHREVGVLYAAGAEDTDRERRGIAEGAGLPLPVTNAVPVIAKPSVVAGLNFGQRAGQSSVSTPSVMLMWCVWAPRVVGSSLFTVSWMIP
jgi:hypothetical protein